MNNKGMTILYVIAALLIATFIGTTLMGLAHNDIISSRDYSTTYTTSITAKCAMQASVAKFEKKSQEAVDFLNAYLEDQNNNWFLGTANHPIPISARQKYSVRVSGFDTTDFFIQLEGIGFGKNSRKKILGVYQLQGIDWESNTIPNPKPINALHLGNGAGEINSPIYIHGNTYINNPQATFCDGSHDSHFKGVVKTGPGNTQLIVRGAIFHGPVYFRCPVLHNAMSPEFLKGVGYERDVTITGSNDPVIKNGGMWINGNYQTEFAGEIKMNGNPIWGWSSKSYTATGGSTSLLEIATNEHSSSNELVDSIQGIYDSLGISPEAPPPFKINLSEARSYAIPINDISNVPTGTDFNNAYNSLSSSQLLGGAGGFMVVEGRGSDWRAAGKSGTFTGKLIWILEDVDDFTVDEAGIFECSSDAVVFLYLKNTTIGSFRNVNNFKGLIYTENDNGRVHIFSGATSHIHGGVYIKEGIYRREGSGTFHIHYEVEIINELDAVGIFSDTNTVEQKDKLVLTDTAIKTTMKGLLF